MATESLQDFRFALGASVKSMWEACRGSMHTRQRAGAMDLLTYNIQDQFKEMFKLRNNFGGPIDRIDPIDPFSESVMHTY